ncbi:MAG: hypothetical protein ACLP9L_23880 [Thermoguttaceae bacterium]
MLFFGNTTADGIEVPRGWTTTAQSPAITKLSDGKTIPDYRAATRWH